MRVTMLGVPIDAVTRQEAVSRISAFFDEPRGHSVFTPNPEMLVMAARRSAFRDVLATADLNIPDGIGLVRLSRWYGATLPERVTGTDLMQDVCALADRRGRSVFLLGGAPGVAEAAAYALRRSFPGLRIAGAADGGKVIRGKDGTIRAGGTAVDAVRAAGPDVLFVAFGHGKQEEWIAANLADMPSVRVAMGIGGAFDFVAGRVARAPSAFRALGMEWLWRLIVQPWRVGRILTAVVVFPYLVLKERVGTIRR